MNLLTAKIKTLYFRYLAAAFGSALISAIYSIVDMVMVGQYHGPDGSAALAVVAPLWNIIYSFGLLMGIGGSVLFSTLRGRAAGQPAMCLSSKKYSDKVNACEMKNGAESWAHFEWAWTEAMTLRYATTGITGT